MPLPVVRSPLGLPLGDRGLLPLPDALSGVGAGVVAGGPYTLPQRMLDTLTGASSRTGAQGGHSDSCYPHTHTHHIGQLSVGKDNSTGGHWPSSPSRHRASARAGAPHMHPPGPFPPAHLDACHEDPALEPPRWRARAQLFTRPAADAGPWRRAARALPACERGKGRRRGWGGGQWAGEAARSGCGR